MTSTDITHASTGVNIDYEAVLGALNLNPRDPKTQALLLVCDRYGLDPVLKHIVLIQGNPYVTRDGYLAVAHRSGLFDGMEVVEQSETPTHYVSKVAVYRKDMGHPFTFVGRFPKSKQMAKEYGPEMALKVAEVQGLRRAFNVTGIGASDERWDPLPENGDTETGEITAEWVDAAVVEPASPEQVDMFKAAAKASGITTAAAVRTFINKTLGRNTIGWSDLTSADIEALIAALATTEGAA